MAIIYNDISLTVITTIIGKDHITDQMRLIFIMPKYGGLGIEYKPQSRPPPSAIYYPANNKLKIWKIDEGRGQRSRKSNKKLGKRLLNRKKTPAHELQSTYSTATTVFDQKPVNRNSQAKIK